VNVVEYMAQEEARRIARRIPGARRRAETARRIATSRPTPDNIVRAEELEAGLARMEERAHG
jgi:hypothetical protein